MKHLFPILLLLTGLLTAACEKHTPEPAPDLLVGRWNIESTTNYIRDPYGQVQNPLITPNNSFYLVITGDSIRYHRTLDNRKFDGYKYARQDKELRFGAAGCTIAELTPNKLTLRFEPEPADRQPNTGYFGVEEHYIR